MRIANHEGRLVAAAGDPGHELAHDRGHNPQRWLADGDVLTGHIEGTGEMRQRFVAAGPVRKEN
jgi:2-keto-4-pentenoate hydratase/2-oxohepta-3-ene-1,7-dioic acid hydratase in catechol pathway